MTIDEVELKKRSYKVHERDARIEGIPKLGSGAIFTTPEDELLVDPFRIPDHWRQLVGLDIGGADHPTAAVWAALDPDLDVIYLYSEYKVADSRLAVHADAIKQRGAWIPVAWPKDAWQHERGASGQTYAQLYRNAGVNMLRKHAQFQPEPGQKTGSVSLEGAIQKQIDRETSGRLKVFRNMALWLEERNQYHRVDGVVLKQYDDLMSATHKAIMAIRFAKPYLDQARSTRMPTEVEYESFARR